MELFSHRTVLPPTFGGDETPLSHLMNLWFFLVASLQRGAFRRLSPYMGPENCRQCCSALSKCTYEVDSSRFAALRYLT